MKFCSKCGALYFLKKALDNHLLYDCRNCGTQEPRDINDNCIYQSDINKQDYMTYQMLKNPYVIRDPTLPRLSNVKCINDSCLTNHQTRHLILLNSHNTQIDRLIKHLQELAGSSIEVIDVGKKDIVEYGEIHTSLGNLAILEEDLLIKNPVKLLAFENSLIFKKVVDALGSQSDSDNLIPSQFTIDKSDCLPVLSEVLREIISIKYDDINMKYMYICSTCGSSWKNIT